MSRPELGTTWEQAIENAYRYGYNEYSTDGVYREIKQQMREWQAKEGKEFAIHGAMNDFEIDAAVHGSRAHHELWDSIDSFMETHMPEPVAERYQREATLASGLDMAYERGVYDALLGDECDPGRAEELANHKPTVDDTV